MRVALVLAALILGGCIGLMNAPHTMTQNYTQGEVLYTESFNADAQIEWPQYNRDGLQLQVIDGAYQGTISHSYYAWALNAQMHEDVVLEISTLQITDDGKNGYGLMCRADPMNDGDGYYFLIGGDGTFSIRRGRGADVEALVSWQRSDAIRTGASPNTVRAVCIDDYLALYVNEQFVAEARDSLYQRGVAGVALVTAEGHPLTVTFDNLTAYSGSLAP